MIGEYNNLIVMIMVFNLWFSTVKTVYFSHMVDPTVVSCHDLIVYTCFSACTKFLNKLYMNSENYNEEYYRNNLYIFGIFQKSKQASKILKKSFKPFNNFVKILEIKSIIQNILDS